MESAIERNKDITKQNTTTTDVEPMVSSRVGYETFFSSPFTSMRNSVIFAQSFFMSRAPRPFYATRMLAGAPGLEPGPSVLETDMLAIDTMPLHAFRPSRHFTSL